MRCSAGLISIAEYRCHQIGHANDSKGAHDQQEEIGELIVVKDSVSGTAHGRSDSKIWNGPRAAATRPTFNAKFLDIVPDPEKLFQALRGWGKGGFQERGRCGARPRLAGLGSNEL